MSYYFLNTETLNDNINGRATEAIHYIAANTCGRRPKAAHARPPNGRRKEMMREVKLYSNIFGQFRRVLAFGQSRHVVTYVMCVEHPLL